MKVYLIGALRNRDIIDLGIELRDRGYDVFDDWISPGPEADEQWQAYERQRGRTYKEAIYGEHATTVFEFDYRHLAESDVVVMVLPAGKSAHLEFGWAIGQGKPGIILFDGEPERYDVMYRFASALAFSWEELFYELEKLNERTGSATKAVPPGRSEAAADEARQQADAGLREHRRDDQPPAGRSGCNLELLSGFHDGHALSDGGW